MAFKIPKKVKKFLLNSIKAMDEFIAVEEQIGEINTMGIIITPERSFLLFPGDDEFEDIESTLTEKQVDTFMGFLNKGKKDLIGNKSIFIDTDFQSFNISFRQEKLDGTIIEFNL